MPLTAVDMGTRKRELKQDFAGMLDRLFGESESGTCTPRGLEVALWREILGLCAKVLSSLIATLCQGASERALRERGQTVDGVRVQYRLDRDYWAEIRTTFGVIVFPWFALRIQQGGAWVTQVPARALLGYQAHCRSSALCLEWETRLGIDHPFRIAQQELAFYSHGALSLEDTTIRDHLVKVSALINHEQLYRTPDEIRDILTSHATVDRETGKPILYLASDAHALRQYIDETWLSQWKMANGLRLWCEDKDSGKIIHLGGEYTFGDCYLVRDILKALIKEGIVPKDGHYGKGVFAQLVWISDGMPWFEDHLLPLFDDIKVILDVYHVLQRFAAFFGDLYGKESKKAQRAYREIRAHLTGNSPTKPRPKPRKGHKKRRRDEKRPLPKAHHLTPQDSAPHFAIRILKAMWDLIPTHPAALNNAYIQFLNYLQHNAYRMDYPDYRRAGYQIGSGAMESLHRSASQIRLKLPGAVWLEDTAQAIFNFRMLRLVGHWNTFWNHLAFHSDFAAALARRAAANDNHATPSSNTAMVAA